MSAAAQGLAEDVYRTETFSLHSAARESDFDGFR
jgi:hypothetical protein